VLYKNYLKNHPAPDEVDYYLCGPPAMIKAAMEMLNQSGIKEDHIVFDEF
jgi:Na+-transporting NADH:ubiquinone oxidoreductase subunit F